MTDSQNLEADTQNSSKTSSSWWIALCLAATGLGLSIYSVLHHLALRANGHTDAVCNINSVISCDAVAASKYSEVFGLPLGVFGAGYFLGLFFLAGTVAIGHKSRREHEPAWFVLAAIGVVTSLILGSISLGVMGVVCLVCIGVYLVTIAQAGLAWNLWKKSTDKDLSFKNMGSGLTSAIIALGLTVAVFNMTKPAAELPKELQDLPGKTDANGPVALLPSTVEIPINRNPYSGLGEDYRTGSDDAKVVVVEFADYQCPACGQTRGVLEDLQKEMGSRIQVVFKNYPLSNQCNSGVQADMHKYSCNIVKLARCAGRYGKFWDFHRKAFDEQAKASDDQMRVWAKEVGLNDSQISECLKSADILAKIKDDADLGNKLLINATPTIFINGHKYLGDRTVASLRSAIDSL